MHNAHAYLLLMQYLLCVLVSELPKYLHCIFFFRVNTLYCQTYLTGVVFVIQIGIDVEEKTRKIKNDIVAFAKRYFSPNEIEVLSAISDPESQRQEFIKLWTLKVSTVARASMKHQFSTCSCIRDFRQV